MSTLAIKVEKLGKEYAIGTVENSFPTLRDSVMQMFRSPVERLANVIRGRGAWARRETFWALRDVSFEIEQGTVVGVVGRNGAGKSTLLKVLSRITDPTEGWAELHGRVGSLLEVGTGFHPELTGRENIFMSGAMLGMKRHEIRSCFDDIVAFSEVGQFLETPVKHYSSGMYTRLAFAVAAHLNPEILIVDEVLAVGDASFQKKCLGKMDAVSRAGKTVLFVSHQMSAIENMCKSCIWLDRGQVRRTGPTAEVLSEYLKDLTLLQTSSLSERTDRRGSGDVRFTGVELQDAGGRDLPSLVSGEPALLVLHFENRLGRDLHNASFAISIDDHLTNRLTSLISQYLVEAPAVIPSGVRTVAFRVPRWPLIPGKYSYTLFAQVNGVIADWVQNAGEFFVDGGDFYGSGKLPHAKQGHFLMDYEFEVQKAA